MKRLLSIVLTLGLSMVFSLSLQAGTPDKAVFTHYVAAQEALAADNFQKAGTALKQLTATAGGEVKTLAQKALAAKDIKSMRTAFKPLSNLLIKAQLPSGLAVAYCSMAPGHWIQENGPIANPYYGASMLRCGEIRKVGGKHECQHDHKHGHKHDHKH